jgi:hypothetical protein
MANEQLGEVRSGLDVRDWDLSSDLIGRRFCSVQEMAPWAFVALIHPHFDGVHGGVS